MKIYGSNVTPILRTRYKPLTIVSFTADVFMCECCRTGSDVCYWNLRLLNQGTLIDAFHWDNIKNPLNHYQSNDSVFVVGFWKSTQMDRFQILKADLINRLAANDAQYDCKEPVQLEFDFSEDSGQGESHHETI